MIKIVLITGCSSGIGLATALYLARHNCFVYATVRNLNRIKKLKDIIKKENLPIRILKLDVTKQKDIINSINTILREKGRIDV
jgi:NADP-dependent 3-hydroxy acid dehydrogenase YdfG